MALSKRGEVEHLLGFSGVLTVTGDILVITECGTADRVMAETKQEMNIVGTCVMCRHMKATLLEDILQALREPRTEQIIELDQEIIEKAKFSLDEMFRYAEL